MLIDLLCIFYLYCNTSGWKIYKKKHYLKFAKLYIGFVAVHVSVMPVVKLTEQFAFDLGGCWHQMNPTIPLFVTSNRCSPVKNRLD